MSRAVLLPHKTAQSRGVLHGPVTVACWPTRYITPQAGCSAPYTLLIFPLGECTPLARTGCRGQGRAARFGRQRGAARAGLAARGVRGTAGVYGADGGRPGRARRGGGGSRGQRGNSGRSRRQRVGAGAWPEGAGGCGGAGGGQVRASASHGCNAALSSVTAGDNICA